ncbi:hypothetical protein Pyn_37758 [Prunus yedoensis var. nudiflora]|uniref:Uncharacterized protein n=1 Tax=Prunus yedoensis var. nudiflora TaxID=2094558 RepID=A0A314YYV9_PRUYE|nr:hypothetical protein Pyn_37758 [Prunus yedoensis var. nudiflora]
MELKTMVDAIAAASEREAEAHETAIILSKENDGLERDELKRVLASGGQKSVTVKGEFDSPEKLVEVDGGASPMSLEEKNCIGENGLPGSDGGESRQFKKPTLCQGQSLWRNRVSLDQCARWAQSYI